MEKRHSEEIYLWHRYLYGDCDCYHCEQHKTTLEETKKRTE